MTPFQSWLSSWSPFHDESQSNRILSSAITEVEQPIHPDQRVEKVWTITKQLDSTSSSQTLPVEGLQIGTPGLTVVNVNPELAEQLGSDVIARVRVTSDRRDHLNRVSVSVTKKNGCQVKFQSSQATKGNLVTEITVATADHLNHVIAQGGGDVVLHEHVVASPRPAAVIAQEGEAEKKEVVTPIKPRRDLALAALFGSRLYACASNADLHFDNLMLGSVGSSSVHVAARTINVRQDMATGMVGAGRIHIATRQFKSTATQLHGIGHGGTTLLTITENLDTGSISSSVRGTGFVDIAVPSDAVVACAYQSLRAARGGRIDVADVQSRSASVKIRGRDGGNVSIRAPQTELSVKFRHNAGLVEYVGELPPVVRKNEHAVLVPMAAGDSRPRVHDASTVPSIEAAFESDVMLQKPSEGFWSAAFRPL